MEEHNHKKEEHESSSEHHSHEVKHASDNEHKHVETQHSHEQNHKTLKHTEHHIHHNGIEGGVEADIEVEVDAEAEKKKHQKSLKFVTITIIVIIGVMLAIMFSAKYLFKNNDLVEYNHYQFQSFEGNKWMTQQLINEQLYNIPFYNNPTQVLDIPVDPRSIQLIREFSKNKNGTIYISVDPYEQSKIVLAGVEYARILGGSYNIYNMNVKSALLQEGNQTVDSPVMTCHNQSKNTLVIAQLVTDKNLVSIDGSNCIILESKSINDSVRVADAFTFRLLNIIQN